LEKAIIEAARFPYPRAAAPAAVRHFISGQQPQMGNHLEFFGGIVAYFQIGNALPVEPGP
jgi:hypothetical protein